MIKTHIGVHKTHKKLTPMIQNSFRQKKTRSLGKKLKHWKTMAYDEIMPHMLCLLRASALFDCCCSTCCVCRVYRCFSANYCANFLFALQVDYNNSCIWRNHANMQSLLRASALSDCCCSICCICRVCRCFSADRCANCLFALQVDYNNSLFCSVTSHQVFSLMPSCFPYSHARISSSLSLSLSFSSAS